MASRTWLAVSLCFLVLFAWSKWFAPVPPPKPETPPAQTSSSSPTTPTTTATTPATAPATPATKLTQAAAPAQVTAKLESDELLLQFSKTGGVLTTAQLKKYKETTAKDAAHIQLIAPGRSGNSGRMLFSDGNLKGLETAVYQEESTDKHVRYTASLPNGAKFEKTFALGKDAYVVEATYKILLPSGKSANWGTMDIPLGESDLVFDRNNPLTSWEVVLLQNEKVTRQTIDSVENGWKIVQGNTSWLAFGNRYFSNVVIHEAGINPDAAFVKEGQFTGGLLRYPLVLKEGQNELVFQQKLFVGPKDYTHLQQVPGLAQLIDYGWFTFFAFPLLSVLKFFYAYIHNYGIAIILLTVLVRALLYPLSVKSFKSMKEMQKLQPQLQALKEKYGEDRQKFAAEQMALFKAHKVNPASGCLPLFVQLPIFVALYNVLANSIDLFQSPFFGWIHDLSARDPLYIFPVLMGLSMLLQQKMTPAVGMDPMQQKMMYLMPVVFTFMMINLPSGLTIYMFVSTLIGILQQWIMMRDTRKGGILPSTSVVPSEKG